MASHGEVTEKQIDSSIRHWTVRRRTWCGFLWVSKECAIATGLSGGHGSEKGTWHLCPGKEWHKGPRWHSGKRNRWGMMGQCAPRTVSSLWLELGTLLGKCQDMRLGENPMETTATVCRWETADTWGQCAPWEDGPPCVAVSWGQSRGRAPVRGCRSPWGGATQVRGRILDRKGIFVALLLWLISIDYL